MAKEIDIIIRRGRMEDEPHIQEFTKDTFKWGDYVGEVFRSWLDGDCDVYVAEADGTPVAVTCVAYPADGEAWFQGIRVHPDYRRLGFARRLTEASIAGAKERGAKICRANIDSDNYRSQGLAQSMGFRQVGRIVEYVVDLAGEAGGPARSCSDKADGSRPALGVRQDIAAGRMLAPATVSRITPDQAASLFDAASKEMRYLGSDYVWVTLSVPNLRRVAADSVMLAARDNAGNVLAGAVLGEIYEDDLEHGRDSGEPVRMCGGMGSFFGAPGGVRALVCHGSNLVRDAARAKNVLPGKLFLCEETDSPALKYISGFGTRAAYMLSFHDDIGLWELELRG